MAGRGVARRTAQPLDSSGAPALEPADDASAVSAAKGGLPTSWRRPATPLQPPELGSVPLDAFAAEFEFWAFHASRPGKGDLELLPRAAAPASADLASARVGRGYCCGVAARGGRCRRGGARARWRAAEDDARRLALAVTQAQAAVQAAGQVLAWAASVTAKGSCAPSSRP